MYLSLPFTFKLMLLCAAVIAGIAADGDCPKTLIATYYSELGCVPKKENNSLCPTSYDCSAHEERDRSKCHYAGKSYSVGEEIGETPFGSCKAGCRCMPGELGDTAPSFNCADIECTVGAFELMKPECRYQYQPGECCSDRETCGDSVKAASVTCTYNSRTYIEGERFDGNGCQVCHCKEKFEGRLDSSFCYDLKCDYQLSRDTGINEGCVPIYFGQEGCCPIDWHCPGGNEKIAQKKTKIRQRTSDTCKFGTLVLQAGDELETTDPKIHCSCQLPPYLTCIQPLSGKAEAAVKNLKTSK